MKYSVHFLNKLENLIAESDYILRYEKGHFKSGWCYLKENKVIIINKFFSMEGRINCLIDIIQTLDIESSSFSTQSKNLYKSLMQTKIAQ